jgi:hypothetical protein
MRFTKLAGSTGGICSSSWQLAVGNKKIRHCEARSNLYVGQAALQIRFAHREIASCLAMTR